MYRSNPPAWVVWNEEEGTQISSPTIPAQEASRWRRSTLERNSLYSLRRSEASLSLRSWSSRMGRLTGSSGLRRPDCSPPPPGSACVAHLLAQHWAAQRWLPPQLSLLLRKEPAVHTGTSSRQQLTRRAFPCGPPTCPQTLSLQVPTLASTLPVLPRKLKSAENAA